MDHENLGSWTNGITHPGFQYKGCNSAGIRKLTQQWFVYILMMDDKNPEKLTNMKHLRRYLEKGIIANRLTASSFNGDEFFRVASMIQPNTMRILISSSKMRVDDTIIHMFIEKNNFSSREFSNVLKGL